MEKPLFPLDQHHQKHKQKQVEHRYLFTKAVHFAQIQMADPVYGEKYRQAAKAKGLRNANNLAVRDYLRPPVIENLDAIAYHSEVGDEILIEAFDDFEVEKVAIEIYHLDGSLLEKGLAQLNGIMLPVWLILNLVVIKLLLRPLTTRGI